MLKFVSPCKSESVIEYSLFPIAEITASAKFLSLKYVKYFLSVNVTLKLAVVPPLADIDDIAIPEAEPEERAGEYEPDVFRCKNLNSSSVPVDVSAYQLP